MEQVTTTLAQLAAIPGIREAAILVVTAVAAIFVRMGVTRVILRLASKTETDLDDQVVAACRGPMVYLIFLAGIAWIVLGLKMGEVPRFVVLGVIKTIGIVLVGSTAMRVAMAILEALSRQMDRFDFIQPKTLPLIEIVMKLVVFGGAVYLVFVAWNIDVTTWLASAGIVGIAVGFAAKDTLANLFSGIFILADAPYKLGDFIILDGGIRGQVVDIGIRSSRLLTRDDIEVTVPNAVIAASKIVNETSGRHPKMRVRVKVEVAYGSDIDDVREVLMSSVEGVAHLAADPTPRVRFRSFAASGLAFELLAWIDEPVFRGQVLDALNGNVYKALSAAGIEIPYSKMDVYLKPDGGAES